MRLVDRSIYGILAILLFLPPNVATQTKPIGLKPTIILISLDGFRYDYLDKYKPPTLQKLAREGVRAKWMIPSFPTKTFPNHYTIVTGLYPQNHGIVENNVYDFGEVFKMDQRDKIRNAKWWLGEPIWVTAEKQGQRAANYFWPGSEAAIDGVHSSIWTGYNGKVPNDLRVDRVLSWLDKPPAYRPTFITLYFSTTDDVGHEFGPDSEETRYSVLEVDKRIERLMAGLRARKIDKQVNVIITADHGMTNYYAKKVTILDEIFDPKDADQVVWSSPIVQIFPKPGKLDTIFDRIKNLEHVNCWKKADIPERFHYNTGTRVAPIVCLAENGRMVTSRKWYDDWFEGLDDTDRPRGAHGYDNNNQEMQATFIAHGAAFKKGYVAEPFENINVYELMCKILGLKPAKNDGSFDKVSGMLK